MTIPEDTDPGSTPSGISPFPAPAPARQHPPCRGGAYSAWPGTRAEHDEPLTQVTIPLPRYVHPGQAPYSPPAQYSPPAPYSPTSHQPPAGLAPDGWAAWDDHYPGRARYWWLAALVGVLVLAATGAGAFWLLREDDPEPSEGSEVSAYGLTYRLPTGWTRHSTTSLPWARDLLAKGVGAGPGFDCGGQHRARALAGVLMIHRTDGRPPTPADAATAMGRSFAHTIYGADATVTPVDTDGQLAGTGGVSARVTAVPAVGAACPVSGQVDVVALPGGRPGPEGQPTVRIFLLQHDTSGGPSTPPPPNPREVGAVLASLRETTPS